MSSSNINVIKRNGSKELLDFDKINNVLLWSTENIKHVTASDIAINAGLQIYDGIKSTEIHRILIQSAADLISEKNTNYQYVASTLLNYFLRKNVFGVSDNLPHLKEVVNTNVKLDVYDSLILEKYSDDDFNILNKYIKHSRDNRYTYAGLQQVIDKYLLKDRSNGNIYETPQYMYMMISMTLFMNESVEKRMKMVKDYYDNISLFKISLPTPILSGVRTPIRQYSSCTLIDIGDSLTSIFNSNSAVGYYTARRAGIGLNFSRIRAVGDRIRNGEVMHTGVIPFLKMFESTTKSCTQNGIRGGSSTTHFPWWHREILDVLVLKNNKGTDDNRVRKMDYSIQLNRIFYKKFVSDGEITLFSPNDVPDLYEAFYKSNEEFEALYEKYERSRSLTTKKIKARELFNSLSQERIGTGRIYIMNIDHVNEHSSLLEPVYMSNLCLSGDTEVDILIEDLEDYELVSNFNFSNKKGKLYGKVTLIQLNYLFSLFYNESHNIDGNIILNAKAKIMVKSKNIKLNSIEYKQVYGSQMTNDSSDVIKLTDYELNKSIICTPEHKVYTKNRGWVEASSIIEDDTLDFDLISLVTY